VKKHIVKLVPLVGSVLLVGSPLALAESSLLTTPYQLAVSGGISVAEDLRGLSPGSTARLTVGIPLRPGAYLDTSVIGIRLPAEAGADRETSLGTGLDLRLERVDNRFNFLFFFGGGYLASKRAGETIAAPFINMGWGVGYEVSRSVTLRGELRGLARFSGDYVANRGTTYEGMSSVGLVYSFGQTAPTAYSPPPPAAASASALEQMPQVPEPPEPLPESATAPVPPAQPARVVSRVFTPTDSCLSPPAGTKVDADGCLLAQRIVVPQASHAPADLEPPTEAALAAVAVTLLRNPTLFATIRVHTDSVGDSEENRQSTTALADIISQHLFLSGVPAERFSAVGLGEERPRASEDDDAGVAMNRRIDIDLSAP